MPAEPIHVPISKALELALQYHQTGQIDTAESIYRQVLAEQPGNPDAMQLLGVIASQRGRHAEAVGLIESAIRAAPGAAKLRFHLGVALRGLKRDREAAAAFRQAVLLDPEHAEAVYNLANVLRDLGERDQSAALYRRALAQRPDFAPAHNNLGRLFEDAGELDQAAACFRAAIRAQPDFADAYVNLGNLRRLECRFSEAAAHYRKAIAIKPDFAVAHHNLAVSLLQSGDTDAALAAYGSAAWLEETHPQGYVEVGNALSELGRFDEAAARFRRAIELKPDYAEALANLGTALQRRAKMAEAIGCYRKALALRADVPDIHNNLGAVFLQIGRFSEALEAFEKALALNPNYTLSHNNLGILYKDVGMVEEGARHFRSAVALQPDFADAHSNLLLTLNYLSDVSQAELFAEHRAWAEKFETPLVAVRKPHANLRDPERRLRVGYVSPDFRSHSVAFFIEPVLIHHDRSRFEVFCYSHALNPDAATPRLIARADRARNILGIGDEQVEALIRADGIDILVDLAGHTANTRVRLFAREPAPVQVAYLGYPNTTGLAAMNYRITDVHADPPGVGDPWYSETLVRLPETFLCYRPPESAPEIAPPVAQKSHITFGSFNLLSKVTPDVIRVWSRLLSAVPGSRLLLKAMGLGDPFTQRHVVGEFEKNGIVRERLTLLAKDPDFAAHMARYGEVDIGLDPFPYNGTTTTFDALWMGVPVVTLAGTRHSSRVGVSILTDLGLAELIAENEEDYIARAVALAADPVRLASMRATMRDRMRASRLLDGARLTRHIETAYREMWRRWCKAA